MTGAAGGRRAVVGSQRATLAVSVRITGENQLGTSALPSEAGTRSRLSSCYFIVTEWLLGVFNVTELRACPSAVWVHSQPLGELILQSLFLISLGRHKNCRRLAGTEAVGISPSMLWSWSSTRSRCEQNVVR